MPISSVIDQLFRQAIANLQHQAAQPGSSNAVGKLYEVKVLFQVLGWMSSQGYAIAHKPPPGCPPGLVVLPAKPASANKGRFSWFSASGHGERLEVWTSLQCLTLSHSNWSGKVPLPQSHASLHELDVAVFRGPIQGRYPVHLQLVFGASCKATAFKKDHLRELLGLRRETAVLRPAQKSRAPWFVPLAAQPGRVKADPPSPVALFCSDLTVTNYIRPVDELGAFPHHFL